MDRFGEDLWNLFLKSGKKFSPKAAYTIGIQMVSRTAFAVTVIVNQQLVRNTNDLFIY